MVTLATTYPLTLRATGVFKVVVGNSKSSTITKPDPVREKCSTTSASSDTTEGVTYYTLSSDIRHYKVLSIVLGILTFVFAATTVLLAAMQIGH